MQTQAVVVGDRKRLKCDSDQWPPTDTGAGGARAKFNTTIVCDDEKRPFILLLISSRLKIKWVFSAFSYLTDKVKGMDKQPTWNQP